MKSVFKKLLIFSCFASLAHCQMGYAGYFGQWESYLANSSLVKTATEVSSSLFDIVREHPYATAAIGVSAALGSLSVYTLINNRKIKREQERIHNLPDIYVDLPEQINGPEPEVIDDKINDIDDLFIIRNKMFELGLLSIEEVMLLHRSEKRETVERKFQSIEAIYDVVETSDASEAKKREFYTWFNERMKNNSVLIKNL